MEELFVSYKLNEEGLQKANAVSAAFIELLGKLYGLCPSSGREYAIVRTKLEEACFYAKKAISLAPVNHILEVK